ncbi:TIGR04255 family protein [Rhizobium sp. BK176]|uniref:TIGR04255 family protein n=1 Tax=Rhizobium sp. BK176 TaxID=2587071 RepID=UPI0021688CC1|nr:TIGR04255 family protein [Rhizobium sp. BK176]MCS4088625.1 uncharacterized protein (TIGR04255 family) [Rhizobium sp. BK176]
MSDDNTPLSGPPAPGNPLASPPIERVILQVQFPEILAIGNPAVASAFQEKIRFRYPFLKIDSMQDGRGGTQNLYRLGDMQGRWRLSLASGFIALETTAYTSKADLIQRLSETLAALRETVGPSHVLRIGIRYLNRGEVANAGSLADILRDGMAGPSQAFPTAHLSLAEAHMPCDEGGLTVRYGQLPPGASPDPNMFAPMSVPTWAFDIDAYTVSDGNALGEFSVQSIVDTAASLANRALAVFRWSFKREFLAIREAAEANTVRH